MFLLLIYYPYHVYGYVTVTEKNRLENFNAPRDLY